MELETEEVQVFVNRWDIDHRVDVFLPHLSIVMGNLNGKDNRTNQQMGRIIGQI